MKISPHPMVRYAAERRQFLGVVGSFGAIALFDWLGPAELPVWVFYFIPLVFTAWSKKNYNYIVLAAVGSGFVLAGYFLAKSGRAPQAEIKNRIIGIILLCLEALVLWRDKCAAAKLQESEEKYRVLVENLSMGLVVHAPDTAILLSNPMASEILGLTKDQMQGKTAIDPSWCFIQPDGSRMELADYPVNRLFKSGGFTGQVLGISRPDREKPVWVMCGGHPVRDARGRIIQAVITFFDITARKQAEEEAEQIRRKMQDAQKLESLGVLAGGIAHDFNNILTAILGSVTLTKLQLPANSPVQPYIELIIEGSHRAADLCKQMLAYSGRGRVTIGRYSLNKIVEDTASLLSVSKAKNIHLRFDLQPGLPMIDAEETQIRQVIMNLVINAAESLGENGGMVTVRTTLTAINPDEPLVSVLPAIDSKGPYICLEVADSGCGMSPETLSHIFDPFFTTKFTGRGLGLSALLGIVRGHQGTLSVRSAPGVGTTFRVFLPRATGEASPAAVATGVQESAPCGRGCVLVADDEDVVCHTVAKILESNGYEAVTASDGRQAVEIFQATPERFDLVVTDLSMPRLDGIQVLKEIRAIRKAVPAVLMSGYDRQETSVRFKQFEPPPVFIQKPFDNQKLLKVVGELLAGSKS